ncbi:molybdate-anion transporter-like isoform X2 [Brachionus plicatilis]|uniref:Molybdate-anion transporter-like isoform X2 n=1 Tax=Brachionus plicatilis TaxID=10195 RepID=A0A3M7QM47_BRAPC|nr:molybdate-anion transporter-like isoform X2 [Brachionus plicatilis]
MDIFTGGLGLLILACAILYYYTGSVAAKVNDQNFNKFQRLYLVVYLLAMMGDWLQGPHVYALYESYKMTKHQIEILFIAGFGSSLFFGTIVGSFADKYGRRFNCILYGVLYSIGCVTKHFNNFHILMFGRLLAGIATSILYSAFESWLIYEHKHRGFEESTLGTIFANAYLGNSVVAILAGIIAQLVANTFGYVAPFDTSLLVLVLMVVLIVTNWSENYGDSQAHLKQSFLTAFDTIRSDTKVLLLGVIQSLFEGSMYVFVLEWTPALTVDTSADKEDSSNPPIPHGYIFAAYMVAVMIGANLFKILSKYQECEKFMRVVLLISAVSLAAPFLVPGNQFLIFSAFILFEICVGIFWPSMGTMRGRYVPETARSTLMNFFRIPLNLIVVVILSKDLQLSIIFQFCVGFLFIAAVCQFFLHKLVEQKKENKVSLESN